MADVVFRMSQVGYGIASFHLLILARPNDGCPHKAEGDGMKQNIFSWKQAYFAMHKVV